MNDRSYFWKSFYTAPLGLILIGAGLCVFGEALLIKGDEGAFWSWFWWGTGGLVLINAGISIMGQAIIYRVKYEQSKGQ
ncbi:MAG: hypothetical protein AAFQ98_09730 [Bacteroidota bacterium]